MSPAPSEEGIARNAICPYFTMFPLDFPLSVIGRHSRRHNAILDPFCGRGTTNFAARLLGAPTIGLDSSPIAVAATAAKLVGAVGPEEIVSEAIEILRTNDDVELPKGQFWSIAYRRRVLSDICKLRAALVENCRSRKRKALRGLILGALHGPLRRNGGSSYFSNQSPRTYAPKPRYAVQFWRRTGFRAPNVNVAEIIAHRAARYFGGEKLPDVEYRLLCDDSRRMKAIEAACSGYRPDLIITSPPYYGLRTYVSDQWIRNWFLGGTDTVDYGYGIQMAHQSVETFTSDLRNVWNNVAVVAHSNAQLVFRFGAINDRAVDPREIIKESLVKTPWRLKTLTCAGTARSGKRQADTFMRALKRPLLEYDAWARLQ